jgi:serine/threonine protein kinase/class 3 adenylate cyclase
LERLLASGGMGSIWVAFDEALRRRVAMKLMRPDQLTSMQSRTSFEHEARAVAQFQHPNVVQIYDYGIDEAEGASVPYIVMELLAGEDLCTRLGRQGKLTLSATVAVMAQLARALLTAHGLGLIHRDLKPANIFLARSDNKEIVKILDFGIAAMRSHDKDSDSGTALLVGTPQYMSPEQIRDPIHIDHRADLYALGVVTYELLTGELPFQLNSMDALVDRALKGNEKFRPISQWFPELGASGDAFFERALAVNPAQRFQSAREMSIALSALEENAAARRAVRVLVVDDEPDLPLLIRQRFRQQIKRNVYDFLFASDGLGALDALRRIPDVDLVLSDINMPGMDGLSMLEHVTDVNPIVKVVMVSAYGDMQNIRQAMNRGAFDFLTKPIDFKDLEKTIDKTAQHVGAARRANRIAEEYALLRMFVGSGGIDKLMPMMRVTDSAVCEQIEGTVAFILIRGLDFSVTTVSDSFLTELNALLDNIVAEVHARQGVIDKFIGYGVFAVFRDEGHLDRALQACLAIRAAIPMTARDTQPLGAGLKPRLGSAIGIDSGRLLAGGVGSRVHGRMEYAVIGEVVSTALRLVVHGEREQIVCTQQLAESLKDRYLTERIGLYDPPDHGEPTLVYNISFALPSGTPVESKQHRTGAETGRMDTVMVAITEDDPVRHS